MKPLSIVLFLVFISQTCNAPQEENSYWSQAINLTEKKMQGLNFVAPPRAFEKNPMMAVKEVGAEWIAVIPYAYTPKDKATVRYNSSGWQWWGERPEGVAETIELAKKAGLNVMLKPQIYMHGNWTGNMSFKTDEKWTKWEQEYENYIMPFVKNAEKEGIDLICIGTEFKLSVKKREHFWRALIQKIRAVYSGKLTYTANWDSYADVPFWDELDYVGISAYFPLLDIKTPTVKQLQKSWQPIRKEIRKHAEKTKKPILFTEFGYLSVDGCTYNTWELEGRVKQLKVNEEAQANAIDALFETFWDEPYWAGGFLWKWFPNMKGHEGYINKDYTPQGKKGCKVLKKWYSK